MPEINSQTQILAQGIYEIRLLLSHYLGSENVGDPSVQRAAHVAYALHNEAIAVIEGRSFDCATAMEKIRAVDRMFHETFASRFEPFASDA